MNFIKLKDIFFIGNIKNTTTIKRDLNQKYGPYIDKQISDLLLSQEQMLKEAAIEVDKGEPWFGKNGILDIEVKIELLNNETWTLHFPLQWNYTSFCSSPKIIEASEWC